METNSPSATTRSTPARASTSWPLPGKVLRTSLTSTRTALLQLREVDPLVFRQELLVQEPLPVDLVAGLQKIDGPHLLDRRVEGARGESGGVVRGWVYGLEGLERGVLGDLRVVRPRGGRFFGVLQREVDGLLVQLDQVLQKLGTLLHGLVR